MPGWTLVNTHPTQGRTFQRRLTAYEHGFFFDGLFNGSTDNIQYFELRLPNGCQDAYVFSEANVARAWISTKRRYPLAGATVDQCCGLEGEEGGGPGSASEPNLHFFVRERDLSTLRPDEIVFGQVTDAEESQRRAVAILHGARPLSKELLVQLYVFREAGSEGARPNVLHVMTLAAHCVTDWMANRSFVRCFLDTLARGREPDSEPVQASLEHRLAMAIPPLELEPMHLRSANPARRRWRRAAAAVILQFRMRKTQGGHTLPCRLTRSTPSTPARSGFASTSLTHAQSTAVIAKCRQHKLTFGNAYLALAQVAMTRVLYRRYLRGEISEEEWSFRKRQPYISTSPINLRPYLDKVWFDNGGGGEFVLATSGNIYRLPFMTLGGTDERQHSDYQAKRAVSSDGAPPFSDLLTFDRFLHRAGLVKKQAAAFLGHLLFLEITYAWNRKFVEHRRLGALHWMEHVKTGERDGDLDEDEVLAVTDIPSVRAHGGSTLGNVDPIFPLEYPLPPTHPLSPYSPVRHPMKAGYVVTPVSSSPLVSSANTAPTIVVQNAGSRLHTCPGELYLAAATERGQLDMYVFYDGNVFEDSVVKEWLDDVKGAVLWYLG